jgi:GNAT superfamily N-acetyltransferase
MIRVATVDDIKPIYDMMFNYYREAVEKTGYDYFTWSEEKAVIYLGNVLWNKDGLNFISENREGMIIGSIGETWFGENKMAKPAALYVKPEHRNGLLARALLRRFEKEAKARGAIAILWEFEIGLSDSRMVGGLMENLGYEYQGAIYKKMFGGNQSCRQ